MTKMMQKCDFACLHVQSSPLVMSTDIRSFHMVQIGDSCTNQGPGYKVSPLLMPIFIGQNVDLQAGSSVTGITFLHPLCHVKMLSRDSGLGPLCHL